MSEFVVIVESRADAETATKLAERVLLEKIEWLNHDYEQLQYYFQWSGLKENTEYSCWTRLDDLIKLFSSEFNFPKIRSHGKLKTDGQAARKVIKLISFLRYKLKRNIKAVIFIRDLDNQPERRNDVEQARLEQEDKSFKVIIGMADRMRESWVLNGFIPLNLGEEQILQEIKDGLTFDPCKDSQRLRSNSFEHPDRERNPKVVVKRLTDDNRLREQKCWEETSLELLRQRSENTGLTDYLNEIEERLTPIIIE
jgi:hypothetical protein